MAPRVDPDYESTSEGLEEAARLLARAMIKSPYIYEGAQNHASSFQKWMLGAAMFLFVSGVTGGVIMYGRLTSIETTVSDLKDSVTEMRGQLAAVENLVRNKP
jgi:hypothetical protein